MCRHGKGEQRQHVVASHAGRSAVRGGALCTSSKPAAIPCRARLVLGKKLPSPPLAKSINPLLRHEVEGVHRLGSLGAWLYFIKLAVGASPDDQRTGYVHEVVNVQETHQCGSHDVASSPARHPFTVATVLSVGAICQLPASQRATAGPRISVFCANGPRI